MRDSKPLASLLPVLTCVTLAAATAACSGGGGGGGAPPLAFTDLLLVDAPPDELLSFRADVTELRLVDDQGAQGANLLPGTTSIELIGLQLQPAWLARVDLPPGTYSAVRLRLQAGSVVALDRAGSSVAINVNGNTLTASFPSPLVVGASGYRRLVADLDLGASLSGDVASPPLDFSAQGSSSSDDGSSSTGIDEIQGRVTSFDAGAGRVIVDAFVDDDLAVALGSVQVRLQAGTVLLRDDGIAYASQGAFFAALVAGQTILEIHGQLGSGGIVRADRIEVEDLLGGGGSTLVKIEGVISDLDTQAMELDLMIREIEKGAAIAGPILGGQTTIRVSWNAMTIFLEDDHTPTTSAALVLGQEVKVKFATFANSPFPASRVEIEREDPEVEGTITDVSGLPGSFVMRAFANEPAVLSGQIASSATDVTVDLVGSSLFLDTQGKPALQPNQLLVGLKVEVEGPIGGTPASPTIDAKKTKIHAGRFDGSVATTSSGTHSFDATVTSIDDPFGNNVTSPPFDVVFAPGALVSKDAASEAGFFALFANLQAGESLDVRVKGIGSGSPNQVLAYEVEAEVD